jgi:hypothetical protein
MPKLTPNWLAAIICVYFVTVGLVYSANTPLFEGPDELAHFVYMSRIADLRELNVIAERQQEMMEQRNFEAHQHPLYYLVLAPIVGLFDRADFDNYIELNPFASIGFITGNNENVQLHPLTHEGDTLYAVWTVRGLNLLLGAVTLLCVYYVGRIIWDARVGLVAMLLTASIPMFVHISASINNDNLNITLSAVAVAILIKMWQDRNISPLQSVALGMTLAGIVLAKLTGITAYGYATGALLLGGLIGRFKWRQVGFALAAMGMTFAVFVLWWFIRNQMLYNDPLGLNPTLDLWSRGAPKLPTDHELWGVWQSFWMVLGHLNIPGPAWLTPYVTTITGLALVGAGIRAYRDVETRWYVLFMLVVIGMAWGVIVYITRQVNVSQGRALFMTLAAFSPLMALGWRQVLGKRWFVLPVLPLVVLTLAAPFTALADTFDRLERVPSASIDTPFERATPVSRIDARAETITVYGYRLLTDSAQPGGEIALDVYFAGGHPENPSMFVTAQHPVTKDQLGAVNTYPGMAPTHSLHDDQTYRARVRFLLDDAPTDAPPFQIELALGWRIPDEDDPGQGRYLDWFNLADEQIGGVFFAGPVLQPTDYTPAPVEHRTDVVFGEQIRLAGYTLQRDDDTLTLDLLWAQAAPMTTNYTLTVGVLDESGGLVAQQDSPPPGYPTSVWLADTPFVTSHTLEIPAGETDLSLRVGWYDPASLARLAVLPEAGGIDDLLVMPLE